MRRYHSLNDIDVPLNSCVITVGMFDGLHLGHKSVLQKVKEISEIENIPSVVLTFSNHPQTLFNPDAVNYVLSSLDDKISRLDDWGIDIVISVPFDQYIASLSAYDFTSTILLGKLHAKHIVFGYDNQFGHNREGSKAFIDAEFPEIQTYRIAESTLNGEVVSSSLTKSTILVGDVKKAAMLLDYPYQLKGCVIKGDQLGRTIGFPTANLKVQESDKLIPMHGVYLTLSIVQGNEHYGMTNIGVRPTVTNIPELRIETHLFNFDKDIYGEEISVQFIDRLRDEKKFDSFPALVNQLKQDRIIALNLLTQIHIAS
jgi:riboflavin kinase/FMN adenylyltransferase